MGLDGGRAGRASRPRWPSGSGGSSPPPSTTSFTPYTSAARNTPPIFSGRLAGAGASAANPSLIGVSLPRFDPLPSNSLAEPDSAFRLPFAVLVHQTVGGFRFSPSARSCSLPQIGLASPRAATGQLPALDLSSVDREFAVRTSHPARSRHCNRRDCAYVRPSLSPSAIDVLTEGSNYWRRRMPSIRRKPRRDRTLRLSCLQVGRRIRRTGPGRSLVPGGLPFFATQTLPPPKSRRSSVLGLPVQ